MFCGTGAAQIFQEAILAGSNASALYLGVGPGHSGGSRRITGGIIFIPQQRPAAPVGIVAVTSAELVILGGLPRLQNVRIPPWRFAVGVRAVTVRVAFHAPTVSAVGAKDLA